GNALRRHLDAQVPAGDHYAVDLGDDLGEAVDGAGLLDLRHQPRRRPRPRQVVASQQQVVAVADEAHRDPVDVELGAELQVLDVLVREGRDREVGARDVDALVVREPAADEDARGHDAGLHAGHLDGEPAVVEEQHVADLDVGAQALVGHADARRVAGRRVVAGERELLAGLELDGSLREHAHADLRALEVLEDPDAAAEVLGGLADDVDDVEVVLALAVREVQPEDVDAGLDQPHHDLGRGAGRTQRGDDLRAAPGVRGREVHDGNAALPRNLAPAPSSASIASSRLYFATRSERDAEPVLICPAFTATARSAMKVSSVSPLRCEITLR